jgi:hypothetical protein
MREEIVVELSGPNVATARGLTFKSKAPIGGLCRLLISEGLATAEDHVVVVRGETPVFSPAPISHYSEFTIEEQCHKSVRRSRYHALSAVGGVPEKGR